MSVRASAAPRAMLCDVKRDARPTSRGNRVDMKRGRVLALDLDVLEHGAVAQDDLGHGVGEVGLPAPARPRLDDRGLGALAGDDEDPGVRNLGHVRSGRVEDELDRRGRDGALRDLDEDAVLDEGRVERREGVRLEPGDLSEKAFELLRASRDRFVDAGDRDAPPRGGGTMWGARVASVQLFSTIGRTLV